MANEPDSLILRHLRDMRAEMVTKADLAGLATKADLAGLATKAELSELRADVTSELTVMRKQTSDQIAGLRRAVVEYHTTVVGHGILISEFEGRLRRVEQHLNLDAQ